MSEIIKLHVAGNYFVTTVETLCKYGGELARLYDDWVEKNKSTPTTELFIDRDGHLFYPYIMSFLRDGTNAVLPTDNETLRLLLNEAKYFKLTELERMINETLAQSGQVALLPNPNASGAMVQKNNLNIDGGLVQVPPDVQVGSIVRVRKNAVDLYYTCLAIDATCNELPSRSPTVICGLLENYHDEQGARKEYGISCWYCGAEKRYRDPASWIQWDQNLTMSQQFLNTAKFTVKDVKENCCVLSPKSIHIPIMDLELVV